MNRQRAIRVADVWRIEKVTQERGQITLREHESISAAKRFTRSKGRCVALKSEDLGQGEQQCGFFRAQGEAP